VRVGFFRARYSAAFDLHAEENTINKVAFLERAAREGWRIVFYHDPDVPVATVEKDSFGHFAVKPVPAA